MIYANFKKGDMMVEENEKSFSFEEIFDKTLLDKYLFLFISSIVFCNKSFFSFNKINI